MSTFITRLETRGSGPKLAVKDLIDVAGVPTTAGCRAVAEDAGLATADAPCLSGARAANARVVGKANLFELAYGASGINEWSGTPRNPLDPGRVPGGSSSGSAVAVATGEATVALGTDTGGSVRIPSACCGTVGLKTTHGRVSLIGVWPLAPSLDTIGPMAADVAGVELGMSLLEPGFTPALAPASRIGRLRDLPSSTDPVIDAAIDCALASAEFDVDDVDLPGLSDAYMAASRILDWEAVQSNRLLLTDPERRAKLGTLVHQRFRGAEQVTSVQVTAAMEFQGAWRDALSQIFRRVDLLALPTLSFFPPLIEEATQVNFTRLTNPFNLAGLPALALPVPVAGGRIPASLQLVGPAGAEELLVTTARVVEAALQ